MNNLPPNDLIDRGWNQLQTQLDEVMPQRKRRRGAWWIWWGLGLLLLMSLGGAWAYHIGMFGPFNEAATPLQPTHPIVSTQAENSIPDAEMNNSVAPSQSMETASLSTESNNTLTKSPNPPTLSANPANESLNSSTIPNVIDTPPTLTAAVEAATTPIITATINTVPVAITEQIVTAPRNTPAAIQSLASNPTALLANSAHALTDEFENEALFICTAPEKHWQLYAEALLNAPPSEPGFLGVGLGAGVAYGLNDRWAIQAGLQYQGHTHINVPNNNSDRIPSDEEESFVIGSFQGAPIVNLNNTTRFLNTRRLVLTADAAYQVAPRWQLTAGGGISFLTKANLLVVDEERAISNQANADANFVDLYSDPVAVYDLSVSPGISNDQLPSILDAPRGLVHSQLGAMYTIKRNHALQLQWQYQFTNWPSRNVQLAGQNRVQVGYRRYF